jgi:hypothetical protein
MENFIKKLKARLKQSGFGELRPASASDLERAKEAKFPQELIDFYRQWEPKGYVTSKQQISICTIKGAITENTDAVPGCALSPHGFIVFASTNCRDSYCIDTNVTTATGDHPVVLFSHEVIEEDMPLPQIMPYRKEVATSLEDFLVQFTDEMLCDTPSYG